MNLINFLILILLFIPLRGSRSYSQVELIQVDCTIFDWSGKIYKKIPGWVCLFYDDGSIVSISYQQRKFRSYSPLGDLVWSKDLPLHHELEATKDRKKILSLSEEVKMIDGKKIRIDILKIYNRKGEELASWNLDTHWEEIKKILSDAKKAEPYLVFFDHKVYGRINEFTHINSIKEIPENDLYPQINYLKPGNLIVGMNCLGFFLFFDPNLTRIEGVYHYQNEISCNTHDAQVLPNGHILFFRNFTLNVGDGATLVEIDPALGNEVLSLETKALDPIKSSSRGSVFLLKNKNLIYIDWGQGNHMGVVEVSRNGEIANALDQRMLNAVELDKPYRVRAGPFKTFLDNAW